MDDDNESSEEVEEREYDEGRDVEGAEGREGGGGGSDGGGAVAEKTAGKKDFLKERGGEMRRKDGLFKGDAADRCVRV